MPPRPTQEFDSPGQIRSGTTRPLPAPHYDGPAFDELVEEHGIRWMHYRSAFCPNITDLETHEHDPNCRVCDMGYIFYGGTEIMGVMSQDKLERMYEVQGLWDAGQAVVTFTSYRKKNGEVSAGEMNDFLIGDKVVCLDYTFTWAELVEHSPTGVDRMKYPVLDVEFLADPVRSYARGTDFEITSEGLIKWLLNGQRPKGQTGRNKGPVYSIRYTANPVFHVEQLLREIRVMKGEDRATGKVTAIRMPQQLLIRRDFMFKHPADQIGKAKSDAARSGTLITPT